jgi:predicted dehydrogenase
MLARVASRVGLSVVAAGSPARGQSGAVADALGAETLDDFRLALSRPDAALILIAAVSSDRIEPDEVALMASARARGIRLASLHPLPSAAIDLAGSWASVPSAIPPRGIVNFVPALRTSRVAREASDAVATFGAIEACAIESFAGPEMGSLGSRLFAAIDACVSLMGEPASVDARVPSLQQRAIPERPSELDGHLTCHLRFADNKSATVVASNRAGGWRWSVSCLGPAGRLVFSNTGLVWIGPDGRIVDRSGPDARAEHDAAEALADALTSVCEAPAAPTAGEPLDVLAACGAALLSARTGQTESPATIRRMLESSQG